MSLYDERYFLHHCGGHEVYRESGGARLDTRLSVLWELGGIEPGMRVLDVGCGRGEIARRAGQVGALCWALDLSPDALRLAGGTLSSAPMSTRRRVLLVGGNGCRMPFARGSFHRVLLSDILEHLPAKAMAATLREVSRVILPGGSVIFHTFPNRWFYTLCYPIRRLALKWFRGIDSPRDPRTDYERLLHVNELSPLDLRRAFGKGFKLSLWCAHRKRWDPQQRRFRRPWGVLSLFIEPEIWGIATARR